MAAVIKLRADGRRDWSRLLTDGSKYRRVISCEGVHKLGYRFGSFMWPSLKKEMRRIDLNDFHIGPSRQHLVMTPTRNESISYRPQAQEGDPTLLKGGTNVNLLHSS